MTQMLPARDQKHNVNEWTYDAEFMDNRNIVNVWIQSFDDVKVKSNKVVSTNIIALRLIQGQTNKIKKKIRSQIISLVDWFLP